MGELAHTIIDSNLARAQWRDVLDRVAEGGRFVIVRDGKVTAVMISVQDYERLREAERETPAE